jgi:hypothetical protein
MTYTCRDCEFCHEGYTTRSGEPAYECGEFSYMMTEYDLEPCSYFSLCWQIAVNLEEKE